PNQPNSFCPPCCMNRRPATMRRRTCAICIARVMAHSFEVRARTRAIDTVHEGLVGALDHWLSRQIDARGSEGYRPLGDGIGSQRPSEDTRSSDLHATPVGGAPREKILQDR